MPGSKRFNHIMRAFVVNHCKALTLFADPIRPARFDRYRRALYSGPMDTENTLDLTDHWTQCTVREQTFINAVLSGKSNRQAAILAGFAESAASNAAGRLLKRERVCKALVQRQHMAEQNTGTEPERIRAELWTNSKAAQVAGNVSASNNALGLLAKMSGALTDKVELTGKDGESISGPLSDADLARRVALVLGKGSAAVLEERKAPADPDHIQH